MAIEILKGILMNWAEHAIRELKDGREVLITPKGNSMQPKIESGAEVILCPIADPNLLEVGDIVLVSLGRGVFLHLISATEKNRIQISNNKGHVNGWVPRTAVYGRAIYINNHPKQK